MARANVVVHLGAHHRQLYREIAIADPDYSLSEDVRALIATRHAERCTAPARTRSAAQGGARTDDGTDEDPGRR